MNLSIYIKLRVANAFGKVKVDPKFKHIDYMLENNFLTPINDQWVEVGGFPLPTHSNWYTITTDGKYAMWNEGKHIVTRLIAWLALLISLGALVISYLTYTDS